MTPQLTRRRYLATVVAIVLAIGLAGCGVGTTNRPVDEGDAAAGGSATASRSTPRSADEATSADDLVRYFMAASAGGLASANDRAKAFLTPNALTHWQEPASAENPSLSVVRIVDGPNIGAPVGNPGRTPVTIEYQVVGTLGDFGRVDDLSPLPRSSLTFWVLQTENFRLRIDQIDGWPAGQLLLSDDGLREYYQIQPIYFWDTANRLLVPDLRYVPLTISLDQRAGRILEWLVAGPSPWLSGVQRLPSGTTAENVITDNDGTLQVRLGGAPADPADPESLRRLMYQLQWSFLSLTTSANPKVELVIDQQVVPVDVEPGDFRAYNHSSSHDDVSADPYDVNAQGVVVATSGQAPTALSNEANSSVVSGAVTGSGALAAFVRADQSGRFLQVVRGTSPPMNTQVPTNATLGRPSFVPPWLPGALESEALLVPTGGPDGRLLSVSTVDGTVAEASGLTGVTAVAVSPDGRRVALIDDGDVLVASLNIVNGQWTVASTQRKILEGQVDARAVTWLSESWLLVGGTDVNSAAPALWRVTADSVLAENISSAVGGLTVTDLVSYPLWTARGQVEALAVTPAGVYTVRPPALPGPRPGLTRPFFGT